MNQTTGGRMAEVKNSNVAADTETGKMLSLRPQKMRRPMNTKATGYILGAVAAATYGMNPLFALPLYQAGMDPDSVLFLRYLLAIPILGIMLKARGRSFKLKRKEILPLIGMGLLVSVSSLTLFQSYNYMAAGIASTLLFVYPILVALIMTVVFREKLTILTILCIALALCGIGMLYEGEDGATLNLTGVVLVMASALTYALYIVGVNRPMLKDVATLKVTYCRRKPPHAQGRGNAEGDILRAGVRVDTLLCTLGLRAGFACGERVVYVAEPAGIGGIPHSDVFPLHDARHPIHRFHADCHSGRIGAADGGIFRRAGIRREHDPAHCLRHRADCRGSDPHHCRQQHHPHAGAIPETFPPHHAQTPGSGGIGCHLQLCPYLVRTFLHFQQPLSHIFPREPVSIQHPHRLIKTDVFPIGQGFQRDKRICPILLFISTEHLVQ